MKKAIKTISLMFMAAATLSLAACSKDDSSNSASGGSTPTGGKQLAKITSETIEEELSNGTWVTVRYDSEVMEFVWSGNRLTGAQTAGDGEIFQMTLSYNNDGQITRFTTPDGVFTPTYNSDGRIAKTTRTRTSSDGTQRIKYYTYTYDNSGNLISAYETYSNNNDWYRYTYTWENGNIVGEYEEESGGYSNTETYSYDNKVNAYSCLPADVMLAMGIHNPQVLSRNNMQSSGLTYTYSGNYPIKMERSDEGSRERFTSTNYYEYTDGTGRR